MEGPEHRELSCHGTAHQHLEKVAHRGEAEKACKQGVRPRSRQRRPERHRGLLPCVVVEHLEVTPDPFDPGMEGEHGLECSSEHQQGEHDGQRDGADAQDHQGEGGPGTQARR